MKSIVLKNGTKIACDEDVPYLIRDGVLYVYGPTGHGYNYMRVGEVEKEVEE